MFLDISGFMKRCFAVIATPSLYETTDRILLEPRAHDGDLLHPVVDQRRGLLPEKTLGVVEAGVTVRKP